MAQILKSNGYDKVSIKEAPNFLLKFMANFSDEVKGMLPYIGNTFNGDVSETMKIFNWKPIPFKNTVLDTATSVKQAMKK
jgi:dihydroflavonol-4-reductase